MNRKFLTRLLNDSFRLNYIKDNFRILNNKDLKIQAYCRYVVDTLIVNRSKTYANDKNAFYGFSPINAICYVNNDNKVKTFMVEFNTVNHFLREKDGNRALEVVQAIVCSIFKENKKDVKNFDIDVIESVLAKIEKDYMISEKEKQEKKEEK